VTADDSLHCISVRHWHLKEVCVSHATFRKSSAVETKYSTQQTLQVIYIECTCHSPACIHVYFSTQIVSAALTGKKNALNPNFVIILSYHLLIDFSVYDPAEDGRSSFVFHIISALWHTLEWISNISSTSASTKRSVTPWMTFWYILQRACRCITTDKTRLYLAVLASPHYQNYYHHYHYYYRHYYHHHYYYTTTTTTPTTGVAAPATATTTTSLLLLLTTTTTIIIVILFLLSTEYVCETSSDCKAMFIFQPPYCSRKFSLHYAFYL
jgi:hypothetical protein